MKLYATTTSERASKGQGGNEYLEIKLFTTGRELPSHRLRILNDETIGEINILFQARHFETWKDLATDKIFINVPEKSDNAIQKRLEYLRQEIRAERISYGELAELQDLAEHIDKGDTELLEAAGVPECQNKDTNGNACYNCEAGSGACGEADKEEKGEKQKGESESDNYGKANPSGDEYKNAIHLGL